VADSCAQVTGGGFTVTVPVIVAEFPDTASLFDGSDDMETGAAFNGDYMGDAFQAAQLIAELGLARWQDSHGVTVQTMRVRKCARVTSRSGDEVPAVTFDALIMPQRVAQGTRQATQTPFILGRGSWVPLRAKRCGHYAVSKRGYGRQSLQRRRPHDRRRRVPGGFVRVRFPQRARRYRRGTAKLLKG